MFCFMSPNYLRGRKSKETNYILDYVHMCDSHQIYKTNRDSSAAPTSKISKHVALIQVSIFVRIKQYLSAYPKPLDHMKRNNI